MNRSLIILHVVQRLQYLARHPDLLNKQDSLDPSLGLVIVTGIGKNSFPGRAGDGSMKVAVQNQLQHLQLPCEAGSNEGRVQVPYDALYQYVQQEQRSSKLSTFLHEASLRYLMVFGGVSGVLAATYVVPKLLTGL